MSDPLVFLWIGVGIVTGLVLFLMGGRLLGRSVTGSARRQAAQTVSDAEREAASDHEGSKHRR